MSLINAICSPKTIEIYMTAALAEKVLTKCRGDKEVVKKVLEAYDDEYDRLHKYCANPELIGKPIYQWKGHFSFHKMLRMAESIAIGCGYSPKEEEEEMKDHSWSISLDDETDECSIPAIKFNRGSGKLRDQKIYFDVIYTMAVFVGNSLGHFDRIRPSKHGEGLKVDRENLKPNKPKFDDIDYFKSYIQSKKMLLYCNRGRVLRSLKLRPQHLGYKTSKWDELSTFCYAKERYDYWWGNKFLKEVEKWHGGKKLSHPHYKIYNYIRTFLWMMSKPSEDKNGRTYESSTRQVPFHEFYNNLFAFVMRRLDRDAKHKSERLEDLFDMERNLIGHNWTKIDKALDRDGKVQLSREQLNSILQERENAVAANIAIQNKLIEKVQQDLELVASPFQETWDNKEALYYKSQILN